MVVENKGGEKRSGRLGETPKKQREPCGMYTCEAIKQTWFAVTYLPDCINVCKSGHVFSKCVHPTLEGPSSFSFAHARSHNIYSQGHLPATKAVRAIKQEEDEQSNVESFASPMRRNVPF